MKHGRLIDADALIEGYKHMGYDPNEHPEESYMEGWCKGFNAAVDHCIGHVIHAPTVEERKPGKWIPIDIPWYQCSECGAVREHKSLMENFCPNCGAKMKGEKCDKV